MIKREEVEALLAVAQKVGPESAVLGPVHIGVEGPMLDELCRAWLVLDAVPLVPLNWMGTYGATLLRDDHDCCPGCGAELPQNSEEVEDA